MEETRITHVAVVPSPSHSHFFPILEFSKRLVHLHPDFHVTCIIPSLGPLSNTSITFLKSLPSNIHSTFLPPISFNDLPQDQPPAFKSKLAMTMSLPSLREVLNSLCSKGTPLAALVVDTLAYEALDLAKELNILSFVFAPWSATLLSFYFQLPKLDETIAGEYRDCTKPFEISGCVPIHGRDLPDPVQDRSSEAYKMVVLRAKTLLSADGIILNNFAEMGEGPAKALANGESTYPPVFLVGPIFTQTGPTNDQKNKPECIIWLGKHPPRSVLYVSFGSGGTISQEQLNELAHGLELSGQKFLWILKAPNKVASAAYHGGNNNSSNEENPKDFLPKGFLERTKDRGFVLTSWAPQIQILSHSSIGGFLSHCGWNSTMESVVHGVPLITWPLFAEQKLNAVILNDVLKVAVRPKVKEDDGIVKREEIEELVKRFMESEEGEEISKRMKALKEAAANAMKEDGSSTMALSQVAHIWKNKGVHY